MAFKPNRFKAGVIACIIRLITITFNYIWITLVIEGIAIYLLLSAVTRSYGHGSNPRELEYHE